jgi:hypothetical protein
MHDTKVKEDHVRADDVWLMKPQVVPVPLTSATESLDLQMFTALPAQEYATLFQTLHCVRHCIQHWCLTT